MVGRSEAAVDWPEYHAQSAFAPLSPVSAPLPAHVVNVTSLSPQGFSMRTSQPSFWQHGMRHQNAGDRGCAGHARGHTSDPRLSMVSQMLSTSTSLPAPLSLQDLELTCGQSLGWARYDQHCWQMSACSMLIAQPASINLQNMWNHPLHPLSGLQMPIPVSLFKNEDGGMQVEVLGYNEDKVWICCGSH